MYYKSQDILNKHFDTHGFKDKFRKLIGDPEKGFHAMIYGAPGAGKSHLSLEMAKYCAENHGRVLYVAQEEGVGYTLQDKIKRLGLAHKNLIFTDKIVGKEGQFRGFDFVFIDSATVAGVSVKDMQEAKQAYPNVSFVFVFQATKNGNFRGSLDFAHEVDVVVKVENGQAHAIKSRFGGHEPIPVSFGEKPTILAALGGMPNLGKLMR